VVDLEKALEIALRSTQVLRLKEKIAQLEREISVEERGGSIVQAGETDQPTLDMMGTPLDGEPLPDETPKRDGKPAKGGRVLKTPQKLTHRERKQRR